MGSVARHVLCLFDNGSFGFRFGDLRFGKALLTPRNDSTQPIDLLSNRPCSMQSGFQICQAGFERLHQFFVFGSFQFCQCFGHCCNLRMQLFHTRRISLHWRKHLGCSQLGQRCAVAWCAHLSLFHWSFLSWRPVPTSFHWMSSVPVRSNGTKSGSPNSRFHNQHSTTTATCGRGNVLSNAHRQMPPWVLGG